MTRPPNNQRKEHHVCTICNNGFMANWVYASNQYEKTCSKTCRSRLMARSKFCDRNPQWKGNAVGMFALHLWVKARLPKPPRCEECKKAPPYDLANISQTYLRIITDWEWLCRRCHMEKDGRLLKVTKDTILRNFARRQLKRTDSPNHP